MLAYKKTYIKKEKCYAAIPISKRMVGKYKHR